MQKNSNQTKTTEIHITKYTMKIIPEMHLVQIVTNTSNFCNLYFCVCQIEYFVFVTKFFTYPENVIPKCFVLDDLVRKNHFLWMLPVLDHCNNDLQVWTGFFSFFMM